MSYSSDSITDRLAAVRAAIDRCLKSQKYGVNGRNQESPMLASLMAAERDLVQQIAEGADGGSMATLGRFVDL